MKVIPFITYLLLISISVSEVRSQNDLVFDRIEEGLNNGSVSSILEDYRGFLWVGTRNGLHRYDGSDFVLLNSDNSFPNGYVHDMAEDEDHSLWIATYGGGLVNYSPEFNSIEVFSKDEIYLEKGIISNQVICVFLEEEEVWIGTTDGISILNKSTGQTVRHGLQGEVIRSIYKDTEGSIWLGGDQLFKYKPSETDEEAMFESVSLKTENIQDINGSAEGVVWIATLDQGLYQKQPEEDRFKNVNDAGGPAKIPSKNLLVLMPDENDLWIGTENGGLIRYDLTKELAAVYQHNQNRPTSIGYNSVFDIHKDTNGRIWLGLFNKGLNVIDPHKKNFGYYSNKGSSSYSLPPGSVSAFSFLGDKLWVASDGGGISLFNRQEGTFETITADDGLLNNAIISLNSTSDGKLLMGSWEGGLTLFEPATNAFTYYLEDPDDEKSISSNYIFSIVDDPSVKDGYWISTWGDGLEYFNYQEKRFNYFGWSRDDVRLPGHLNIFDIEVDRSGDIWLATDNGLNRGRLSHDGEWWFDKYYHDPQDSTSISSNSLGTVYVDAADRVWIGSNTEGLNYFNRSEQRFQRWKEEDGLSGNSVAGIVEDDMGFLWVATNKGLTKVYVESDPSAYVTLDFTNYNQVDGVNAVPFDANSAIKDKEGKIYLGGENGMNVFDPSSITQNSILPPVFITKFLLFDQLVQPGDSVALLTQDISMTDTIELDFTQDAFSFEFAALNFTNSANEKFKYQLVGFDKEWRETDHEDRKAIYTSIPPGDYVFNVIASNSDGLWNQNGASLYLIIRPPYWETNLFRFTVVFLIVALLVIAIRIRIKSILASKIKLERKVHERTLELNGVINELRNTQEKLVQAEKFSSVATITKGLGHELNNPMNYIKIGMELIEKDELPKEQKAEAFSVVREGVARATKIVKVLSTLTSKGELLNYTEANGLELLRDVISYFDGRKANIDYHPSDDLNRQFKLPVDEFSLVIQNIIANALYEIQNNEELKEEEKAIQVRVKVFSDDNGDTIEVRVHNKGRAIPEEVRSRIFDPFYTTKSPDEGQGLGLAQCYFLVGKMNGFIDVQNINEGVEFNVRVPTQDSN